MKVDGVNSVNALTKYNCVGRNSVSNQNDNKESISKTDQVDINSSSDGNDIMTIYEMLCSEFPEANYILTDNNNENELFFNNINSKLGNNFGSQSEKSIFIDISTIKKIQEDSTYYAEAKSAIKIVLDGYDAHVKDGIENGRPYVTGYVAFEGGRMSASWSEMESSFTQLVEKEEGKLDGTGLTDQRRESYVKQVQASLLDKYMESVTDSIATKIKNSK